MPINSTCKIVIALYFLLLFGVWSVTAIVARYTHGIDTVQYNIALLSKIARTDVLTVTSEVCVRQRRRRRCGVSVWDRFLFYFICSVLPFIYYEFFFACYSRLLWYEN